MATATQQHDLPSDSNTDTYSFTLILSGVEDITPELENGIYGGGCDDALLGMTEGAIFLDFDREAGSLMEAITSAIKQVENAPGLRLRVTKVIPPGERIIAYFNAMLTLRDSRPDHGTKWSDEIARGIADVLKGMQR